MVSDRYADRQKTVTKYSQPSFEWIALATINAHGASVTAVSGRIGDLLRRECHRLPIIARTDEPMNRGDGDVAVVSLSA